MKGIGGAPPLVDTAGMYRCESCSQTSTRLSPKYVNVVCTPICSEHFYMCSLAFHSCFRDASGPFIHAYMHASCGLRAANLRNLCTHVCTSAEYSWSWEKLQWVDWTSRAQRSRGSACMAKLAEAEYSSRYSRRVRTEAKRNDRSMKQKPDKAKPSTNR